MKKIIVLGAGLVGNAMALDLAKQYEVCSVDASMEALNRLEARGIRTVRADLTDEKTLKSAVSGFDLVVGALPGFLGYQALKYGRAKSYTYDLLDRYDAETDTISMARTTGYTCTAVANLVLSGQFGRKGICPPEYIGETEKNFRFILEYLKMRGVTYMVS